MNKFKHVFSSALMVFLMTGCYSDLRIADIDKKLTSTSLLCVAVLPLPPYAYPTNHTIAVLRNRDFSLIANNALETAIMNKRKAWKVINSANLTSIAPKLTDGILYSRDNQLKIPDSTTLHSMQNLSQLLGCNYLFVIERISVKDISTVQTPSTAIMGAWLQVWDMREGKIAYHARNITRPVSYSEDDFEKKLFIAFYDLFSEALRPLPKT